MSEGKPEVTRQGVLDMQVCVPAEWNDRDVELFATAKALGGNWAIRRQGDRLLAGCDERTPCAEREGFVHMVLDA